MRTLFILLLVSGCFTLWSQEKRALNRLDMKESKEESSPDSLNNSYTMSLEPLCPSKGYNECMGIELGKETDIIYFATNGKNINKFNLTSSVQAETIVTIKEVTRAWNDEYGDTFLHDMKLGKDGYIYAVAENCVLKIDKENESYETIIKGGFQGPWGGYGIALDEKGNILVGDHYGGIHIFMENENWAKKTIIKSGKNKGDKKSFGGLKLDKNILYYLDFENSLLVTATLKWKEGMPEVLNTKTLYLPLNYPEYLQIWNGDVFAKAARENKMLRIRNNQIIQEIDFTSDSEVSPIVTFRLQIHNDNTATFYGTSWGPNGTLFRGKLNW